MAKDDVTIGIGIESKGAIKDIKRFSASAKGAFKSISDSVFSLKGAVVGVGAVLAGGALINGLRAITEAASRQDDAINNLNTALKISGEFSAEASKGLQDYASSLQANTKFGDELILEQLSLAKAFGATNEQAKDLVTAATELSAATGKSLPEATAQLSKTLGGFAGELGEVNSQIKALSSEQLKAGAAAKILIDQYGGSAAAQVNTFSGAIEQNQNVFGDLLESLGAVITQNPAVITAIKGLTDGFKGLIKFVENNQEAITNFVAKAVTFLVKAFAGLGTTIAGTISGVTGFIKAALNIQIVNTVVTNLIGAFDLLRLAVLKSFEGIVTSIESLLVLANEIPGIAGKFDGAINSVRIFREGIEEAGDSIAENIGADKIDTKGITDNLDTISMAAEKTGDVISKVSEGIVDDINKIDLSKSVKIDVEQKISTSSDDSAEQKVQESAKKVTEEASQSIVDAFSEGGRQFLSGLGGGIFSAIENGITLFSNIPSMFVKAADSLIKAIANIPGAVAESLKELPRIVSELTRLFADPKFLKTLAEAIPKIAQAIVDSLPAIVDGILNALPAIIDGLSKAFVKFIDALPDVFKKIFDALPAIFESILKNLPQIITAILDALPEIVKALSDAIPALVETFAENIAPIVLALVEGLAASSGEIVTALIDSLLLEGGLERIIGALIRAMPRIAVALVLGVTRGLTSIFESFASLISGTEIGFSEEKFNKITDDFITKLSKPFDKFQSFLEGFKIDNPFDGGGGSSKGPITGISGSPLAMGGTIPAGFNNDNFPASLTSGELVVPRDDVTELRSFLRDQKSSGGNLDMSETNALLAKIAGQGGSGGGVITLNEDGLTEMLLDFSRRNERVSA